MSNVDSIRQVVADEVEAIRRGLLRMLILKIIAQERLHGYALMERIKERTSGRWKPSPGSLYPALKELQVKGWIKWVREGNRKIYSITPEGRRLLKVIADSVEVLTQDVRDVFGLEIRVKSTEG